MSEAGMTPKEALAHATAAESMETPLRQRAEGVTWMIWGLAAAGIWLTYDAISPHLFTEESDATPLWFDWLWLMWVVVGGLATWAVWRLAALHWRGSRPARHSVGLMAGWIGAGGLAWGIVAWAWQTLNPEVLPVLAIGTAWLVLAVADPLRATRMGRTTMAGTGIVTLAAGIVLGILHPGGWGEIDLELVVWRVAASGLPAFAAGLWQALRG